MDRVNLLDSETLANPYPLYAELRREAPAVQIDPNEMWAITRFADVVEVLRRVDDFSSKPAEDDRGKLFENAFGGARPASRLQSCSRCSASRISARPSSGCLRGSFAGPRRSCLEKQRDMPACLLSLGSLSTHSTLD